jgi:hypothetical protein
MPPILYKIATEIEQKITSLGQAFTLYNKVLALAEILTFKSWKGVII